MRKSMLIDPSKCMGCRGCQIACKQWNQLPAENTSFQGTYQNPPSFSPITWTMISFNEYEKDDSIKWNFTKQGCMHCVDAACKIVCPTGAIYHTQAGTVRIDHDKCIGCNYCAANCPFNVISFERRTNLPTKCTFCYDRIQNGLIPSCAAACPSGAIVYDDRSKIINLANSRVIELREMGSTNAFIYGLEELDGTGMVYILEDSPDKYNLPVKPDVPFAARLWGMVFKPLRFIVLLAMGFGLWSNRVKSSKLQKKINKKDKTKQKDVKVCYPDPGKEEDQ